MPGIVRPLLAEAGAAVGASCVALHVVTAVAPGHGDLLARSVLLVMATGCLPCVRGLWLAPTPRVWAMTGVMYAAMLVAHLVLLAPGATTAGLHHGGSGPTWTDVGMWGGLALAVVQLALVSVVLVARLGTVAVSGPSSRWPSGMAVIMRPPEARDVTAPPWPAPPSPTTGHRWRWRTTPPPDARPDGA